MGVLCGMNTIQYFAQRLHVHKLFTSCIWRCLLSRACDWVMSALSALLLIYSFQSRPAFLPYWSARWHSGVLGLPNIGHRTLQKIWVGFLYDFELIQIVKMENWHPVEGSFGSEFPAICNHCVVMLAWSRKTIFKILFWKFIVTPIDIFFKCHKIWWTGNQWNRALFSGHKYSPAS